MKITSKHRSLAALLVAMCAALAVFVNSGQAQVTLNQVTNGLVDYYPMNTVLSGNITPDLISRRDLTMVNMTTANIVSASHPGINESNTAINFNQSGGATVAYYATLGQNPGDGSGDFLPFINQRGATMNFWVKVATPGDNGRVVSECANDGQSDPFFSIDNQDPHASFFLRDTSNGNSPFGDVCTIFSDGTYQLPAKGPNNYYWAQGSNRTTNNVFDNTWHMLTTEIATNGDVLVFVDGIQDPGTQSGGPFTDNEGNLQVCPALSVTNTYYTTNIYPAAGVANPPPSGYVHWMVQGLNNSGKTTFGGFVRNNSISAGTPAQISDAGFWNRTLTTDEIHFVMTNGIPGLTLNTNVIVIGAFSASANEIGQNGTVNLSWNVTGASSGPGGIVISGVGDVTALGPIGSTNVTLPANQTYTFTLTAHNGIVADKQSTQSIKILQGVPTSWNLIQRFDGLFTPTTGGINGNNMTSLSSFYNGALDLFNVANLNNNEVMTPKSGYHADSAQTLGYDTEGAITWANLNSLTVIPGQKATMFFRFSVTDPGFQTVNGTPVTSGLDLAAGLTDYGFAGGPLGYTNSTAPGSGTTPGPGFRIVRYDSSGNYQPTPYNLVAADYDGSTSTITNSYSYTSDTVHGNINGLQTNVTYYCWLDVSNDNTHGVVNGSVTNTVQEPVFSLWIQKQGDPSRTLLFSGFHGGRDYSQYGANNDFMTPNLSKAFFSVGSENFAIGDNGAFFATNNFINMVVLDDVYLSANSYNSTIPRLFNLTSIVQAANGNVTINWESLGSLFQTNTYTVQRKINLTDANWTTLQTGVVSGGDTTSFTDTTVSGNTQAFYRITWP